MHGTILPIENHRKSFITFIELIDNKRIFFSAPFGMGKTFFLSDFFAINYEKYNTFHLYPVKYQIYNDVDIVKVIATDLFVQLTEKHEKTVKEFLKNEVITLNRLKYATNILVKCIGFLVNIKPEVINIIEGFFNNEKKIKIQNEIEVCNNFLEELVDEILKKTRDGKENVLILDDLDRLDPKHVFKILNAFSPLYDKDDNKFNFDRVIFVGDINNLKKVYHHMYGNDTDFYGYIDKFFSITPYQYNMKKEILNQIQQIISGYCHIEDGWNEDQSFIYECDIHHTLIFILIPAIQMKKINMRNLFMPQKISFLDLNLSFSTDNLAKQGISVSTKILIEILFHIFCNDKKKLLDAIILAKNCFIEKVNHHDKDVSTIFSVKEIGEYMLYKTFLFQSNLADPALNEKRNVLRNNYYAAFNKATDEIPDGLNYKDNYIKAAENFFNAFYEYIEKEIYKTDLPTDPHHLETKRWV